MSYIVLVITNQTDSVRERMADVHDKATRSKNMRAIATRDTAIEKRLASLLETLA
jgi:hypothetical protein